MPVQCVCIQQASTATFATENSVVIVTICHFLHLGK